MPLLVISMAHFCFGFVVGQTLNIRIFGDVADDVVKFFEQIEFNVTKNRANLKYNSYSKEIKTNYSKVRALGGRVATFSKGK